jgi:hypothetical protein
MSSETEKKVGGLQPAAFGWQELRTEDTEEFYYLRALFSENE